MGTYSMQKYYKIMTIQSFFMKNSHKKPTENVILTASKQGVKNKM